ncbi:hypothetical protein COLO4_16042 [Corchorus olitorius]|uniref:Uncharacterized protein n=1 Tax=Corchorus olitorius TaxID=93759 RepID=A0A1R3JK56_9ROSI|nr:hypothetical protein COLO4_16042 [Corchorus olitorius]
MSGKGLAYVTGGIGIAAVLAEGMFCLVAARAAAVAAAASVTSSRGVGDESEINCAKPKLREIC